LKYKTMNTIRNLSEHYLKELNRLLNIVVDDINFSDDNQNNKDSSIETINKIKEIINNI